MDVVHVLKSSGFYSWTILERVVFEGEMFCFLPLAACRDKRQSMYFLTVTLTTRRTKGWLSRSKTAGGRKMG
jgi:hypothetical protein